MHHTTSFIVNPYYTLIIAVLVVLLGHLVTKKVPFLSHYSIPEPVTGGLIIALLLSILYAIQGFSFQFNESLKDFCMLSFFASVGLSADLKKLYRGGKPLVLFTVCIFFFLLLQNIVGVGCAFLFKPLAPLHGLILGSIPLAGGHSTASSWGSWFEQQYHLMGASSLSVAAATYGLIAGGLVGGPIAHLMMRKIQPLTSEEVQARHQEFILFESHEKNRLITADSTLEVLAMFAICLSASYFIADSLNTYFPHSKLRIPSFVWALLTGALLRNTLTYGFSYEVFDRNIDIFGNVTLYLFLAIALISLKLWELSGLSFVAIIILLIQTLTVLAYVYWVTFKVMGKDYDAVILCAGQCGFGLGATPTAIANMQALTDHYGPSPKAFLIVPMVGAFFIDILNALILTFFQYILT
ncbi:MAG: sodium/glutamate symporter [Neisseriaceae bacterium]